MPTLSINPRGQLTIPTEIRRQLGCRLQCWPEPGSSIDYATFPAML